MITAPGRYTGVWMEAIEQEPRKHVKAFDIVKTWVALSVPIGYGCRHWYPLLFT